MLKLFGGMNPLTAAPVIDVQIPGLKKYYDGKVRAIFEFYSLLLMVVRDLIGAFDQKHLLEGNVPAHYPGKGMIIRALDKLFTQIVGGFVPIDQVTLDLEGEHKELTRLLPPEILLRSTLHLQAESPFKVECIVRDTLEGSGVGKTEICGQEIPKGLRLGDELPRLILTPTSKASKGHKDQNLTLKEFAETVGDADVANYIYGISMKLHLEIARHGKWCGYQHPDDKFEFSLPCRGRGICLPAPSRTSGASGYCPWCQIPRPRHGRGETNGRNGRNSTLGHSWTLPATTGKKAWSASATKKAPRTVAAGARRSGRSWETNTAPAAWKSWPWLACVNMTAKRTFGSGQRRPARAIITLPPIRQLP